MSSLKTCLLRTSRRWYNEFFPSENSRMQTYETLASEGDDDAYKLPLSETPICTSHEPKTLKVVHSMLLVVGFTLAMTASFAAGALSARSGAIPNLVCGEAFAITAHTIPLPPIQRTFTYPSPFAKEPPQGHGSGQTSEPVWDALIPSKLKITKHKTHIHRPNN